MDSKKSKLVKAIQEMRHPQLYHFRKEMKGIHTIGQLNNYRRRRLAQETVHYNHEYDRVIAERSQTNVPYSVRHYMEQRNNTFRPVYSGSQLAKNKLLLKHICLILRNELQWR